MSPKEYLKNKNVVIMGLGVFGGGAASAKFCYKHGACVLVTDLRDEKTLYPSLKLFTKKELGDMTFVLGRHRRSDLKKADIVIVNPGVPNTSPYLKLAKEYGAKFENDTSLFFRFNTTTTIGITGTRGKTTTVNWITQLLSPIIGSIDPIGNIASNPLLKNLQMKEVGPLSLYVAELSSWQLELLPESKRAPHIAVITNIYPDHLNRYRDIKDYANAKANIFKHQTADDFLILNYNNPWSDFFLKKKPKAQIFFFSTKKFPKKANGIFIENNNIIFQKNGIQEKLLSLKNFEKKWGVHNTENLIAAILAIHLYNNKISITQKLLGLLTEISLRQQTIYKDKQIKIINDSTATSPNGLIAAIERFKSKNTFFIAGGTRKDVSFDEAAYCIKKHISPHRLTLLSGSATDDLLMSLRKIKYPIKEIVIFETLEECVKTSLSKKPEILVFSPGAASFEKFKNEFDRGEQFNILIKKYTQRK